MNIALEKMMSKHTLTPWKNVGREIRSPNGQPIASLFDIVSTNETRNVCGKANAEFIVEAANNYESLRALNAELVDALKGIETVYAEMSTFALPKMAESNEAFERVESIRRKAKSLIAKAKGEQK